ncbi:MAG: hypothetical protein ACE5F7_01295 [Nitrospiria bacterium]
MEKVGIRKRDARFFKPKSSLPKRRAPGCALKDGLFPVGLHEGVFSGGDGPDAFV